MIKWNITYIDRPTEDKALEEQHCAVIYAKDLQEALKKIEAVTDREITRYTFNLEELRNGVK